MESHTRAGTDVETTAETTLVSRSVCHLNESAIVPETSPKQRCSTRRLCSGRGRRVGCFCRAGSFPSAAADGAQGRRRKTPAVVRDVKTQERMEAGAGEESMSHGARICVRRRYERFTPASLPLLPWLTKHRMTGQKERRHGSEGQGNNDVVKEQQQQQQVFWCRHSDAGRPGLHR